MTQMQEKAIAAIEAQQPKERGTVWMIGEQLKDIVRSQPQCADIIEQDLQSKDMGLAACNKKFSEFAKAHGGCVIPVEADRLLREFYGLPPADEPPRTEPERETDVVDLASFF